MELFSLKRDDFWLVVSEVDIIPTGNISFMVLSINSVHDINISTKK